MQTIFSFLPKKIAEQLQHMPPSILNKIEEIRIRIGRPIEISAGRSYELLPFIVTEEEASQLLNRITQFSMYTMEEELKRGYITIEGGHRVGIAGKVILDSGYVKAIIHISSYNIRIAREKIGCAESLIPYLYEDGWKNTMIIGPPQSGKTTILRDLARIISVGNDKAANQALKVGIVDERSEIAGCVRGVPQLQFGPRIDVLDACPKAEGMMMLIRSMSPDVIVADEIGRTEDAAAVIEAIHAGIKLIITTHGYSFADVMKRPSIQKVMEYHAFDRFVILGRDNERGFHYKVTNGKGEALRLERGMK
ncbi:MAG: stage III sporulation protein AA [Bacillus sp. (in: firmicutes)]